MNKKKFNLGIIGVKDKWSSEILVKKFSEKGHCCKLLNIESIKYNTENQQVKLNEMDINNFDAIIIKKIGATYSHVGLERLDILNIAEKEKQTCFFSKPSNIKKLYNRLNCTLELSINNISMPKTIITEDIEEAVKAAQNYERFVLKPLYSTKARGMKLIDINEQLDYKEQIINFSKNKNKTIYMQKAVEIPGQDMGVVFIGGKYVKTYARKKSTQSWNTTTANGGQYIDCKPSKDIIDLAYKAQNIFQLDFTCVDIAETPNGPVVFEVSAFGGFRGLKEAYSIDAADLYIDYVLGKIK